MSATVIDQRSYNVLRHHKIFKIMSINSSEALYITCI